MTELRAAIQRATLMHAVCLGAYAANSTRLLPLRDAGVGVQHKVYTSQDAYTWHTEFAGTASECDAYRAGINRAAALLDGWGRMP